MALRASFAANVIGTCCKETHPATAFGVVVAFPIVLSQCRFKARVRVITHFVDTVLPTVTTDTNNL
jgi:hypothetical protein